MSLGFYIQIGKGGGFQLYLGVDRAVNAKIGEEDKKWEGEDSFLVAQFAMSGPNK
jgi:hypothetical protein